MSKITNIKLITFLLILAGILSACELTTISSTPTTIEVSTPRVTLTVPIINTPIVTQQWTPTLSASSMPVFNTTSTSLPVTKNSCPIIETDLQKGSLSTGIIIYLSQSNELYSLSSKDSENHPFLTALWYRNFGVFHGSPDHKWVAFDATKYDQQGNYIGLELGLTTGDGRELKIIPWNNSWNLNVDDWLDNDRLILSPEPSTPHGTILLYNPFTNKQQEIKPTFPDTFDYLLYRTNTWNSEHVLYDPTLKRVIYLSSKGVFSIILWNLEIGRELWRFSDPYMSNQQPVWSPDGTYFIFVAPVKDGSDNFEFHKVSKDGVESRLIDQKFPLSVYVPFVLSPDGRYLAYVQIQPNYHQRLLLITLPSKQIIDYCISAGVIYTPIWSPDSRQLTMVIDGATSPFPEIPRFNIIVDIAANKVILINESIFPEGWLLEKP
jgi:hypothetical protein